jgi:acetyl esterase
VSASVVEKIEAGTLRAALGLPDRLQRLLAGPPVVLDGQTLAVDTQLMLRLKRVARVPGAETLPLAEGRAEILHQTRLTGGAQPIGAVRDLSVAGRSARLYTPRRPSTALLVFFHGGGFLFGDLDSHDAICRFLAEGAGVQVLAVDYRLGPEEPFPAAYDDVLAAYEWVVDNAASLGADPTRLAVGGDSAGGNLAAVTAIEAARRGWPLAFQLLVYPTTDCARDTRSFRLFGEGFYLTQEFMGLASRSYLPPDLDLRDPRVSPLHADLPAGLAPAYVVTAGFDPLRDEGEAYARHLAEAGAEVELKRFPDQIHGFFNILVPGTRALTANTEIAARLCAAL